mmetsp:Transcript_25920/g.51106  ORF Transcript_25920/g.51106 Transcript_25920/m.51106 type:complete len:213 (+) Transcript_25920:729-1367(+)
MLWRGRAVSLGFSSIQHELLRFSEQVFELGQLRLHGTRTGGHQLQCSDHVSQCLQHLGLAWQHRMCPRVPPVLDLEQRVKQLLESGVVFVVAKARDKHFVEVAPDHLGQLVDVPHLAIVVHKIRRRLAHVPPSFHNPGWNQFPPLFPPLFRHVDRIPNLFGVDLVLFGEQIDLGFLTFGFGLVDQQVRHLANALCQLVTISFEPQLAPCLAR